MTSGVFELLWRNALGVVPVAVAVALLARFLPVRPATRHSMWLAVLLFLLLPPVLPELGLVPDLRLGADDAARSVERPAPPRLEQRAATTPPGAARTTRPTHDASPDTHTQRRQAVEPRPQISRDRELTPEPRRRAAPGAAPGDVPTPHGSSLSGAGAAPSAPGGARRADTPPRRAAPPTTPTLALGDGLGPFTAAPPLAHLAESGLVPGAPVPADAVASTPAAPDAATVEEPSAGREDDASAAAASANVGDGESRAWFGWLESWRIYLGEARRVLVAAPPIPAAVWLLGVIAALAALLGRTWASARMFRQASPAPGEVRRRVQRAARDLGLRNTPETVMVSRPVSPMIWCGRTLRLVLPEQLWNELDDVGREAVVRHELAHLKRRDHWIRRLEMVVSALYWWHPIVWWIRRRIEEEADYCCDVWVTALMPQHRSAYARALLQTRQYVSQGGGATPVWGVGAASARKRRFARRLTMVMTHRLKPTISFAGLTLAAAVAIAGAVSTPLWACPPEKEKARQAERVSQRAEQARQNERDSEKSTFEEYIEGQKKNENQRDGAEADGGCDSDVEVNVEADSPAVRALPEAIARLDADMIALNERLRSTLHANGHLRAALAAGAASAPCTPSGARLRAPAAVAASAPGAPGLFYVSEHELIDRTYSLPADRLEKLSDLMVRDDVPILVRPNLDDGEILVRATRAHHRVFADFVALLTAEDRVESYKVSEGKLDDLTELMALNTVPTLITPGDDDIKVHGDDLTQRIFGDFVRMIDPDGPGARAAAPPAAPRAVPAPGAAPSPQSRALQSEAEKVRVKSMALMREATRLREMISSMRGQAANVRAQANAVEAEAERHHERSEDIREKAEELRQRAESTEAPRRYELMVQAESLETEAESMHRVSEVLERQVEMLHEQAEAIEHEAEGMDSRIEELEEEAEELREALREQIEELEEDIEERASAVQSALGEQYEAFEATLARRAEEIVRWLERDN